MADKVIHSLYGGEVKIVFYPNSHRYKLEGEKNYLLGTTTVTGKLDKSRVLMKWATNLQKDFLIDYLNDSDKASFSAEDLFPVINEAANEYNARRDRAASNGSAVHDFAERFGKSKLGLCEAPEIPTDAPKEVLNGISAFLDWYNGNDVEFIACEKVVYSRAHGYVGTFDALIRLNGVLTLIDYKTSKGIYSDMHYQASGYKYAHNEECYSTAQEAAQNLGILHFCKETGSFKFVKIEQDDYEKNFQAFLGLLTVAKREKELNAR